MCVIELGCRSVEDYTRIRKPDNAIGKVPRVFELMQRDDGGDAVLLADRAQKSQHCLGGGGIEAGDGFVGKDHCRLLRERTCDADALLLAAGELIDACQSLAAEPNAIEAIKRKLNIRARKRKETTERSMKGESPGEHIVECAVPLDQLMLLEDRRGAPPVLA